MLFFLKNLPLTFYSAPFYKALVKSGKGLGLGFLVVATCLNLGALFFSQASPFASFLKEKDAFFESLPVLTIKDGLFSIDSPSPFEANLFEKIEGGPLRFLFDTSDEAANIDAAKRKMQQETIFIMVTKNHVLIRDDFHKTIEEKTAAHFQEAVITRDYWRNLGNLIVFLFFPLVSVFLALLLFSWHFLSSCLGAIFLLIMAPLFKIDPSFKGVFRLAAAAKIPVATLSLFALAPDLLNLLLWFGFASFGLLASREAK